MWRAGVLCLALAACTQAPQPSGGGANALPQRAFLYPVGVTLLMSDGTLCAGHRPGRARDWTGQLTGCPHLLPYSVTDADPAIPRLPLQRADTDSADLPRVTVAGLVFTTR